MYVTKASGEIEKFQPEKIKRTCMRAGATEKLANRIMKEVTKRAYDGIPTREILKITLKILDKEMPHVAARYDLKGSIMRLGPAGFLFEHLIAEILKEYDYDTKVHSIISGACVQHEVDVIAIKQNKSYMIECKYHNTPGVYTGIRDILYTYARFLDLVDGYKANKCEKFDQAWLVCNTKFSSDVIQYAKCKNIKLTGWRFPTGESLEFMIETKRLYPITILRNLDRDSEEKLVNVDFLLCKDLLKMDLKKLNKTTGISKNKLQTLINESKKILGK